jgi:hypothetical protein
MTGAAIGTEDRRAVLSGPDFHAGGRACRLGGFKLIPGMPVEVFVKTDRAVMSCVVKPLSDQIAKAFRERESRMSFRGRNARL